MELNDVPEFHSPTDEEAVLGCLLYGGDGSAEWVAQAFDLLSSDLFYVPRNQTIFEHLAALFSQALPLEPVSVASALQRSGELDRVGGAVYLHDLASKVVSPSYPFSYISSLVTMAAKRKVSVAATRLLATLRTCADVEQVNSAVDEFSAAVATDPRAASEAFSLVDLVTGALERADPAAGHEQVSGVRTGLRDVDSLVGEMLPGQLVIVGARPSAGKSIFLYGTGMDVALRQGKRALFVSLEMSLNELGDRAVAAELGVPLRRLTDRDVTAEQWSAMGSRLGGVLQLGENLTVVSPDAMDLPRLAAVVRAFSRTSPLSLVVVDYLQLLRAPGSFENRQREVSFLSAGLKQLARRYGVTVLVASQLNRAPEARHDKRPALADLRESGGQEQDGDVVMLIHRPGQYDSSVASSTAEILVVKNRQGATGSVEVYADLERVRFRDAAP